MSFTTDKRYVQDHKYTHTKEDHDCVPVVLNARGGKFSINTKMRAAITACCIARRNVDSADDIDIIPPKYLETTTLRANKYITECIDDTIKKGHFNHLIDWASGTISCRLYIAWVPRDNFNVGAWEIVQEFDGTGAETLRLKTLC